MYRYLIMIVQVQLISAFPSLPSGAFYFTPPVFILSISPPASLILSISSPFFFVNFCVDFPETLSAK